MKKLVCALATLFLLGCATHAPEPNWSTIVMPYDQPVSECTKPIPAAPLPTLRAHSGEQSANAFKKLKQSYVDLSADYEKCQTWAKGQR